MAGVGDVNGDGHPDFAASAPGASFCGNDTGAVLVYSFLPAITPIGFEFAEGAPTLENGRAVDPGLRFGAFARIEGSGQDNFGAALFDSDPFGPNANGADPDLLVDRGHLLILQENAARTGDVFDVPMTPRTVALWSSTSCPSCTLLPSTWWT